MERAIISEAELFAIKSFKRSRQCFLPQPLFDSTNNCFISPSAPQIHALTQIWSFSSCLVSFHPLQRFRTPPLPSLWFCKCFIFYSLLSLQCGYEFFQSHYYSCILPNALKDYDDHFWRTDAVCLVQYLYFAKHFSSRFWSHCGKYLQ